MSEPAEWADEFEGEEEEGEGEEGDAFDMGAELAPMAPLHPAMSASASRRGSVSVGGRRASVSVGFQLNQAKASLRKASVSGDLHEMQAALATASMLGKEDGLGQADAMDLAIQASTLRSSIEAQGG
eukprot:SAG22_NODE_9086_length_611_cov_0.603516_1_plen_126_part_10